MIQPYQPDRSKPITVPTCNKDLRVLVICNCSSRKRLSSVVPASAGDLEDSEASDLIRAWMEALAKQSTQIPIARLYCGRGFSETLKTAQLLNADLLVVSAGLGLVDAATPVPVYNATVSGAVDDNILKKMPTPDAALWWQLINVASPYACQLDTTAYDLVLVALSGPYLKMFAPQLARLPTDQLRKVRLFSATSANEFPLLLRNCRMPYDTRFDHKDSPLPGTKSDFAQRAMRHFAIVVSDSRALAEDLDTHRQRVESELRVLEPPSRAIREKVSDDVITTLIRQHWSSTGGRSTIMLRHLRDTLGVACEQKRFQKLFSKVKTAPTGEEA